MAVGAFPLIKLGALAIRQIAKPIANMLKERAKASPFFRVYVCMPPAQMYHYFEVNVKFKMLGLGKPSNVKKLNEAAAIELGAEMLGETIIFLIAVATLSAEYYRQSKKSAAEAAQIEERWTTTERRLEELEFLTEKQRTEIRELTRLVYASKSAIRSTTTTVPHTSSSSHPTTTLITVESKPPLNKLSTSTKSSPLGDALNDTLTKLNVPK